jgi:dTDP-4-amino-4,6-dideoxygalactose transaminase
VETRTAFIPLHLQPIYRAAWRGRSFPVSEDWGRRGLLLPSGPWLTEAQIDYVCRALLDAPRAAREPGRGA